MSVRPWTGADLIALALLLVVSAAPAAPDGCLRAEAAELVGVLGVERSVAALCGGARGEEAAAATTELTRRVLQGTLEVDSAIAALQEEQTSIADLTNALQSARDARVGWLNAGAGILGAGAAVGTGLTLRARTTTAGIWTTTITSGIGALLAIWAALAPARGEPPLRTRSDLLAPFFDRPLASGHYPQVVWAFLGSVAPDGGGTRRERLVATWRRLGRVDPDGGADARRRIDALCRAIPEHGEADVDLLQDRSRMLGDVRAEVATMKAGLRSLLELVEPPPRRDADRRAAPAAGPDGLLAGAPPPLPGRPPVCPVDEP